jgi:signal transduction histidine kinase
MASSLAIRISTLCLLLAWPLHLALAVGNLPLQLQKRDSVYSLSPHIDILEDPKSQWDIAAVSTFPLDTSFVANTQPVPKLGYTASAYWFRCRIAVPPDFPPNQTYLLTLENTGIETIDFFIPRTTGGFRLVAAGILRLDETYEIPHRYFTIRLPLDSCRKDTAGVITFYVRCKTQMLMIVPLTLSSRQVFFFELTKMQLINAIYYGLLLSFLIYNLIMFFVLRDKTYLYYVSNLFFLGITLGIASNAIYEYVSPALMVWLNYNYYLPVCLAFVFGLLFERSLLNLATLSPRIGQLMLVLIGINGFIAAAGGLFPVTLLSVIFNLLVLTNIVLMVWFGCFAAWRGNLPARLYLLGWAAAFSGTILYILKNLDIVSTAISAVVIIQIGTAIEAILFSFALAYRFRIIHEQQEQDKLKILEAEIFRLKNVELARALSDAETQRHNAEQANQLKSELLGMVAHDLRNPLQIILLMADSARAESGHHDKAEKGLTNIKAACWRMIRLIDGLLDAVAVESGKITLRPMPADVSKYVEVAIEHQQSRLRQKNQRLETQIQPECFASIDAARFVDVIDNLISNAVKYSATGSRIWINVRKKTETENEQPASETATTNQTPKSAAIRIEVRDEGQGLTPEDKANVFGKFQRLSAKPTAGEPSIGLGLFIVKTIVELHGGKIWAESEGRGKGSSFILEIPAITVEADQLKMIA